MFFQSSNFILFLEIFMSKYHVKASYIFLFFRVKFGKMVYVYPIFHQFGANSEKSHIFGIFAEFIQKFLVNI